MDAKSKMITTYQQAQWANDRRPTCIDCGAPTNYSREYRATKRCLSCYLETPLTIQRKELIHGTVAE